MNFMDCKACLSNRICNYSQFLAVILQMNYYDFS